MSFADEVKANITQPEQRLTLDEVVDIAVKAAVLEIKQDIIDYARSNEKDPIKPWFEEAFILPSHQSICNPLGTLGTVEQGFTEWVIYNRTFFYKKGFLATDSHCYKTEYKLTDAGVAYYRRLKQELGKDNILLEGWLLSDRKVYHECENRKEFHKWKVITQISENDIISIKEDSSGCKYYKNGKRIAYGSEYYCIHLLVKYKMI